jgi:uncharacterized protein YndB with AHSA1/START domain
MAYGKGIFVKQNGVWKEVKDFTVNTLDGYVPIKKGFTKVNGVWKQFYPSTGELAYNLPGTYDWLVPPGVRSITIDATAGGGGGGGSSEVGSGGGGGGGGSGGYVQKQTLTVVPGETIKITVGYGGDGAPFVGRTSSAPSGQPGRDTVITGSQGTITLTGGQPGGGGTGNDGGGGGGGSIICTRLHQLGYLSDDVYAADEKFGEYLRATDPNAYYGYLKWAGTVLDWIDGLGPDFMFWVSPDARATKQSELVTRWTIRIATPWAEHMAYTMGVKKQDNRAGRLIMKAGKAISRIIGKFSVTTKSTNSKVAGYALWATFSIFWLLAGVQG